jgi:hypothetical protein
VAVDESSVVGNPEFGRDGKKERRVLWYPTQANTRRRLEWGTQPSLPPKKAGHHECAPNSVKLSMVEQMSVDRLTIPMRGRALLVPAKKMALKVLSILFVLATGVSRALADAALPMEEPCGEFGFFRWFALVATASQSVWEQR